MSRVVLSRLWYIFPADDQNLRPDQFARKVRSYVRTLSVAEQLGLLEFLVVQYEAFQKQLEVLFAHASVTDQEYRERAERLAHYLDHLHGMRRSLDTGTRRELEQRLIGLGRDSALGGDETRLSSARRPPVPGPIG
jgi:hypothetical protein